MSSWNHQQNNRLYPIGNNLNVQNNAFLFNTNQLQPTNNNNNRQINQFAVNRNVFSSNCITNNNQSNSSSIGQLTQSQIAKLSNIGLPPLPKELQIPKINNNQQNNNNVPQLVQQTSGGMNMFQQNNNIQMPQPQMHATFNQNNANNFNQSSFLNNLLNTNHVQPINGLNPLNININNVNNIKNVNINHQHNGLNPNYIINAGANTMYAPNHSFNIQPTTNDLIQQIMRQRTAQSLHTFSTLNHNHQINNAPTTVNVSYPPMIQTQQTTQNMAVKPKSFEHSSQNSSNFTNNSVSSVQKKSKKPTQKRIKLRFKRPKFKKKGIQKMGNTNPHILPPKVTKIALPKITPNPSQKHTDSENEIISKPANHGEIVSETKGESSENETIDKTQSQPLDETQFVDVNGVEWDNSVNWNCGVCLGADAQEHNPLVVCEGCSRAIHQNCYNMPSSQLSSDGDWYCQVCKYKQYILDSTKLCKLRSIYKQHFADSDRKQFTVSDLLQMDESNNFVQSASENTRSKCMKKEAKNAFDDVVIPLNVLREDKVTMNNFFNGRALPKCKLCIVLGGAYKLSSDNVWVHVCCCLYHPNVSFLNEQCSEYPILDKIPKHLLNAKCNLCESTYGAKIKCTKSKDCDEYFHITCMQQNGLYLFKDADLQKNALTAYCTKHTNEFKQNNAQKMQNFNKRKRKISGKKRKRQNDNLDDYKPKGPKPKRTKISSKKSKKKLKTKLVLPEFSPEPSIESLEYLEQRTNDYLHSLMYESDKQNVSKIDDISSVSSQEIDPSATNVTATPKNQIKRRIKRRKSAVDLLSHSSFALKRNKWAFNQTFHLYPNRSEFCESKDFEEDTMNNPNHWTLETTTDATQNIATLCMRSVETLWTHRQTNILAKSRNSRDYRKAIGFSILRNPKKDVISSCNWSFWEVSATKKAVLIKLFITEPYSNSHIPQRRKKNGTLLACHVLDISFRLRDDVDFVVICSERGIAEIFWRALGFIDFTVMEKRSMCRGTEKDLNQFRDTILLRMNHREYLEKYCDGEQEWNDDNCAVQKIFRKWRKKHLFMQRNVVFKHKGKQIHSVKIESY